MSSSPATRSCMPPLWNSPSINALWKPFRICQTERCRREASTPQARHPSTRPREMQTSRQRAPQRRCSERVGTRWDRCASPAPVRVSCGQSSRSAPPSGGCGQPGSRTHPRAIARLLHRRSWRAGTPDASADRACIKYPDYPGARRSARQRRASGRPGASISAIITRPCVESVTKSVRRPLPPKARLVVDAPAAPRSTCTGSARVFSTHT